MTPSTSQTQEVLGPPIVHGDARLVEHEPLQAVTSGRQWAYAVSYPVRRDSPLAVDINDSGGRVTIRLTVLHGRIGVGITNSAGDAYVLEKFVSGDHVETSMLIPAQVPVGAVVFRNASETGASEFVLRSLRVESLRDAFSYPVQLSVRDFEREPVLQQGDAGTVFDTEAALRINAARLDWLRESGIVQSGTRVLDAGAGVGHFLPYYLGRHCTVVALDGRPENVALMRARHPDVDARVADVQRLDADALGEFDVIHCFGLLYHLESPIAALRIFRKMCRGVLILETMVCDSSRTVCVMADETKAASQALDGLGCRPSPSFLALALNRVGFRYVYGANPPPRHEEFQFAWKDNLDTVRDNHALRCVFVAADVPIGNAPLFPVID